MIQTKENIVQSIFRHQQWEKRISTGKHQNKKWWSSSSHEETSTMQQTTWICPWQLQN